MREQRNSIPTQTKRPQSPDFNGASPHRAGHSTGIHPEDRPRLTDERQHWQHAQRPLQYQYDDGTEDDAIYNTRPSSSARRYQVPATQVPPTVVRYHRQVVPPRSSRTQAAPLVHQSMHERTTEPTAKRAKGRRQWHWLVLVGVTMVVGIVLYGGGVVVLSWWHSYQDDLHYGCPRTAQYDMRVGHSDTGTPSHFLALNLNRQIEIIEFPGGDATKAKVYIGPMLIGDGEDLVPVTLEFKDVNRDGKLDMIVHIKESRTVFINDTGQFRLAKPSDTVTL